MKKDNRSVIQTLTLIFQFGISMLVPIFLCSILGVWLGNDSVFLYGSFGRVYEYLQDSKETIQAGGKERKPC